LQAFHIPLNIEEVDAALGRVLFDFVGSFELLQFGAVIPHV
jgi:hypothetical protein